MKEIKPNRKCHQCGEITKYKYTKKYCENCKTKYVEYTVKVGGKNKK